MTLFTAVYWNVSVFIYFLFFFDESLCERLWQGGQVVGCWFDSVCVCLHVKAPLSQVM